MKKLVIKTLMLVFASVFFLMSGPAFADIYRWTDKDGILHITDDLQKVPPEHRGGIEPYKTEERPALEEPSKGIEPTAQPEKTRPELYGEYTLEEWRDMFKKSREEIEKLDSSYQSKKRFVELFESGRRVGQTYSADDVETYVSYKKNMPDDESRLKTLKDALNELIRKATNNGVPKDIRGE
ncbi:MAG: DUF4124 domain-containing protein [Deltaproteobacteria bacterium]|nr:DUF4124 domain-containing protein [Deltaproteobacteria bacterium]